MAKVPFHFPFGGRLDTTSHTDHPYLYTREAKNVRARDPVTGRIRGARRSGLTKWNASAIGTGRIRALVSTAYDDRKLEYDFTGGAASTLWAEPTPEVESSHVGRVDSQGNVYAIDGNAGLVKFNSAGAKVMQIALPVAEPLNLVRALWVDDAGRIFAGVSSGGDVAKARMWCILQLQDNEYQVLWTLEPGAFTEDLRVYRGSQLYAAHNYTLEKRSRVLVYEGLGLEPFEASRIESVAYPIHGMDVREDGTLYCASGPLSSPGSNRANREAFGAFTPPLVGWKPTDDSTIKLWSWFDADDPDSLGEEDVEDALLESGSQVLRWRDKSGNGRHWYAGSLLVTGETGPEYLERGIGGRPCIRFDTGRTSTTLHSLCTNGNASIDKNFADQQRTAVPGYTGAMWAMFLVVRPSPNSTQPAAIAYLENEAVGATDHVLFANRNSTTTYPGALAAGFISYYAATDSTGDGGQGAAGPPPQSLGFEYGNASVNANHETGCVLVTILWDGGVDPNDTNKTRCLVRYNGQPIDRFEGLPFETTQPNWLGLVLDPEGYVGGEAVARRFRGEIAEMIVVDRRDRFDDTTEPKVLTYDALETGSANTDQTDNQVTRIEAYLAYKWGLGNVLPNDDTSFSYQHPYGPITAANVLLGPPAPSVGAFYDAHEILLMPNGLVSKHDAQGVLKWAASSFTGITASGAAFEGGYGYGVRARKIESDELVHVWSVGPSNGETTGTGDVALRKLIDLGATYTVAVASGGWIHKFASNADFEYEWPRMDADQFGNVFVPGSNAASNQRALHVLAKDGSAGAGVVRLEYILPAPADFAFAVALPPDSLTPEYRDDIAEKIAEHVYIFATAGDGVLDPSDAVFKIQLVTSSAVASGTPRTVVTLAVTEDDIRVVTDSTNVVATGGTAVLDGTAQYVQALRAGDDIVFLDGVNYYAYSLRDGTVAALESTSAGEIPPRAKLAMYWRHRLVVAGFADNPYNYAASRLGNIRDWNLRPGALPTGEQIQTSTQAFTGTLTRAGEAADPIVALIPVWDDLAYILGESRILRLTGDPQDGGNIHLVTDSMGGTFGDSWCKDSTGRVFMFGNAPPGLYQLLPDRDPVPLSRHTLEESEFADIDFSTHRMLLCWNPIDKGVHIFQVAWGTSSVVDHWFWEERTHRLVRSPPLWTDSFGSADLQPTSVTYLGGDDTRCLLIGCSDGYIRKWDPAALTDDGEPVDGYFMAKLTPGGGPSADWLVREIQVALADDQGGALLEMFSGETADSPGAIQESYDLTAGLNESKRIRLRGAHLWARIRSAAAERWAWESGEVDMVPRGKPTPSDA